MKYIFKSFGILSMLLIVFIAACGTKDTKTGDKNEGGDKSEPLNLSVFVDLSDRIEKHSDNMLQADKDKEIIGALAQAFVNKQVKEGFQKSNDCFQVVFYPAPEKAQSIAENLTLDLHSIQGPKKTALLNFKNNHSANTAELYDRTINEHNYIGSDIWGFFKKDKVKDLCREGYRNVLVILSDGYIYDINNKTAEDNRYSYILPQTLAIKGSELLPCKISNPDLEIYFMECNPMPQTDFEKMKDVLEKWFKDMVIKVIDIQDTDIPSTTIKHLNKQIFDNY